MSQLAPPLLPQWGQPVSQSCQCFGSSLPQIRVEAPNSHFVPEEGESLLSCWHRNLFRETSLPLMKTFLEEAFASPLLNSKASSKQNRSLVFFLWWTQPLSQEQLKKYYGFKLGVSSTLRREVVQNIMWKCPVSQHKWINEWVYFLYTHIYVHGKI